MTGASAAYCPHNSCFAPEIGCILGNQPCENLEGLAAQSTTDAPTGPALPWSGLPLGTGDLAAVTATGPTRLIALVGAAGVGKTTALAAHWIAARRAAGKYGEAFSGSLSLLGWQQIAKHLQWKPYGSGGFPPHTSSRADRSPALLHKALQTSCGHVNFLFTDVPGEWYTAWAYNETSIPAASWLAENADAFVLFADSAALSGEERGQARTDYDALAARVATVCGDRPVVPILTKADVEPPASVRDHIQERNSDLFGAPTTSVSIQESVGEPITAVLDLAIDAALSSHRKFVIPAAPDHDLLLAFRSLSACS